MTRQDIERINLNTAIEESEAERVPVLCVPGAKNATAIRVSISAELVPAWADRISTTTLEAIAEMCKKIDIAIREDLNA